MDSLNELYNTAILPADEELEKQAAELMKVAEEEDAAGRIMARGFASELSKLAQGPTLKPRGAFKGPKVAPPDKSVTIGGGQTVKPTTGAQGPTQMLPDVVKQPPKKPKINVGELPGMGGKGPLQGL